MSLENIKTLLHKRDIYYEIITNIINDKGYLDNLSH